MDGFQELLECGNGAIADAAMKCEAVFAQHEKALVSISGGADSDIMLDICERVRPKARCDVDYVFFDTGLEYRATRDHIGFLEDRYGIEIHRQRSEKSIPLCAKTYGQPFMSKMVSQQMGTLQAHDFQWDDATLTTLRIKYPDAPVSALRWWTNDYMKKHGAYNSYCVGRNKWLREFIIENPPDFRISNKCCTYAKKKTKANLLRDGDWDVELVGVRRAEGGVRSLGNRCFIPGGGISRRRCVQAPLLDGQRRRSRLQGDVRHRQLRLLCEVGVRQNGMRRLPVQQEGVRRPRTCGAVRAEPRQSSKEGVLRKLRIHADVHGVQVVQEVRTTDTVLRKERHA